MPADRTKKQREGGVLAAPSESVPTSGKHQPAAFAFTANVTPDSFAVDGPSTSFAALEAPPASLFPDVAESSLTFEEYDPTAASGSKAGKSKKKSTHGRKKAEGAVKRPANAFLLFRASFIKQEHVPAAVESNHSTLSKIIGLAWQQIPPEERNFWHAKARAALEEHRRRFPNGTKAATTAAADDADEPPSKGARKSVDKSKAPKRKLKEIAPKDLVRCEKIASMLVEGKKGAELDAAIQEFDRTHEKPQVMARFEAPLTARAYRRSSSAPVVDGSAPAQGSFFAAVESAPAVSTQPRSASAEPKIEEQPEMAPIQLDFNMGMFAPEAQAQAHPPFTFSAPPDTPIFESGFHFQPQPAAVDPLAQYAPSPSSADFDPSMPPLVERPWDPLTDGMFPPDGFPQSDASRNFLHAAAHALPRLSVNTLALLEQFAAADAGAAPFADVGTPDAAGSPFAPADMYAAHSPADASSPFAPADDYPPPLSASQGTGHESVSMPGTPVDDHAWEWPPVPPRSPAAQQVYDWSLKAVLHDAESQPPPTDTSHFAVPAPSPVQPAFAHQEHAFSIQPQQPLQFAYDPYAVAKGVEPHPGFAGQALSFRVQLTDASKAHCMAPSPAALEPWQLAAQTPLAF